MNPPSMRIYNAAQQSPFGVYPNGDGPYPTIRQRQSQRSNPEVPTPASDYTSPMYDQQSPQQSPTTDHNPTQPSQQPPTQQPTPPQSFINPSSINIKQSPDDKAPETADPVLRYSNPDTPGPVRQPSQLYGSWQSAKSYGQDPPPSRGSVTQQPGLRSSGSIASFPPQQPPDNPPINASSSIPMPPSSNPRVVAQSPRYVNAGSQNPIYARPHIPKEEVCLECAMRDQDMADVDVTSPGVWERDSDVHYDDLVRSEEEAFSNGTPLPEDRPRSTGDMLSVTNLKLWLTMVRFFPIPTVCRNLIPDIHSTEPTGTGLTAREYGKVRQSSEIAPRGRDARPRSSDARIEATGEQNAGHLFTAAPLRL